MDLLITFEAERLARHPLSVVAGGGMVYTSADAETPSARLPCPDERARTDPTGDLTARGLSPRTTGRLAAAPHRGVRPCAVPCDVITRQRAEPPAVAQAVAARTRKTVAGAVACALLGYDPAWLAKALAQRFSDRTQVIACALCPRNLGGHAAGAPGAARRQALAHRRRAHRRRPCERRSSRARTDEGEACPAAGSRRSGDADRGKTPGLWRLPRA